MGTKNKTIVVIEDEYLLQHAIKIALEREGFRVFGAENGEKGLQLVQKVEPDAILLDIIMPKKDGYETLQDLHDSSYTKQIPVIVLTNLAGSRMESNLKKIGAAEFIVKSNVELKDIVVRVKYVLTNLGA